MRLVRYVLLAVLALTSAATAAEIRGRVVGDGGKPIASRIYLHNKTSDEWLFVKSAELAGTAVPYDEEWVPMPQAIEKHTSMSAHRFVAEAPPGEYEIVVERGKECYPLRREFTVGDAPVDLELRLECFENAAGRGWYSGETHVHRTLEELPTAMLAEELNVAFPVTFWTIRSDRRPDLEPSPLRRQGPSPFGPRRDAGYEPIAVDATHVIAPRNTEYEIFSIGEQRHVLGAMFILNHKSVFDELAPPAGPIAARAHAEGALLDLDKHNWPWSMMLAPVAKVDLYELSNNSVWRTNFGFNQLPAPPSASPSSALPASPSSALPASPSSALPAWMNVEQDSPTTMTEWGWLNYGFSVYYALLNCGLEINPTAGTASGVHPVPLGYSRVYVHTGDEFTLDRWLAGLKAGRSFATTGPMLYATLDGAHPGETFRYDSPKLRPLSLEIETQSVAKLSEIEVVVNGRVVKKLPAYSEQKGSGPFRTKLRYSFGVDRSSWIAVRCVQPGPDGRKRFAHTAPWRVLLGGQAIAPVREEVEYFVGLMEAEIERNRGVLGAEALAEFEQARDFYRSLLPRAIER